MGFFGSGDKVQTDISTQVGASEEAKLNYAGTSSNAVSGTQVVGSNIAEGTLALTNSNVRDVTITDGGAFNLARDFVASYNKTLSDLVGKQEDSSSRAAEQTSTLLQNLLTGFGALVESKNTDGASSQNKTVLYIALAIAAVFAVFFFRKSR